MNEYRLYLLDHGGHINEPPRIMFHESDEEAIKEAQQLFDGTESELWKGDKRILRLPLGTIKTG